MANRLIPRPKTLLYLYGITRSAGRLPASVRGVDGMAPVQAMECSGFTCWASQVDAHEFGDNLARNMENLEWLADASVRHQRVVGAIHQRQAILPARFGIVFHNEPSLAEHVSARKAALQASFRRIEGSDEWGVRVYAEPHPAPELTKARTGKEYLQRKSALLQARPPRVLEPEIAELALRIGELATASAAGGKVGSGQPGLRWQISVLLPRSRRLRFQSLLARFAEKSASRFRVECTGPWPPYSFVSDETPPSRARPRRSARSESAQGVAR